MFIELTTKDIIKNENDAPTRFLLAINQISYISEDTDKVAHVYTIGNTQGITVEEPYSNIKFILQMKHTDYNETIT